MSKTKSLTEGTPWKLLLSFSVPILIGQIVQLFYSLVDTKVVGATLGELALASVGSVSTLYNLTNGFCNGLTLGFSIVLAMYFGRKDGKNLKRAFAADILLSLMIITVVIAGLLIFLHPVLGLLHVPADEMEMSVSYIRVLIIGLFATILYNMYANALRAIGDSVTPLIFLIVAALTNVVLDYGFILGFGTGVEGAAWATVISQVLSVALCMIRVRRKFSVLHVKREDFRLRRKMVTEMLKGGLSMSLMSCLVSFGTVSLQSAINQMGTSVIVAHTATRKIFEIVMVPSTVLSSAMATFSGQNFGAGRLDRIRAGLKSALLIGLAWSGIAIVIIFLAADALMRFIASSSNPEVIYWGATYIRLNILFMIVCICVCVLRNTMQGFGNRVIPVISSLIELAGKIIFAFVLAPVFGYWGIIWSEPVAWIAMVIPLAISTIHTFKKADLKSPYAIAGKGEIEEPGGNDISCTDQMQLVGKTTK